jgi:hypothetical protein
VLADDGDWHRTTTENAVISGYRSRPILFSPFKLHSHLSRRTRSPHMDSRRPRPPPLEGSAYVSKLLKFLSANRARLAQPPHAAQPTGPGNLWQQSYTLLTLGLDPNSSPLSWNLAVPLTLGFGSGSSSSKTQEAQKKASGSTASSGVKPLTLRLPPDRLLYLLLLFQSSPTPALSSSPNIGRTDVPVPPGVQLVASRPGSDGADVSREGDVKSVRSWVGSLRSVGLGTVFGQGRSNRSTKQGGWGWFGGKKEVMDDGELACVCYDGEEVALRRRPAAFRRSTSCHLRRIHHTSFPHHTSTVSFRSSHKRPR